MECAVVAVSLVVPSYKRSRVVMRCLESIQHQTLADFELLLVDNSPEAELRPLVADFNETAHKKARYVPEPRLGLHNARHAGARAATGDVLVFTDDDAGFDPDWLAAYARCFGSHPDMAAAGGPIRPAWESPPPDWLTAFMRADPTMFPVLSLLDLSREFQLRHDGIFFGVNMAIRRDALFEAGGFNPEIFGDRWLGDGERRQASDGACDMYARFHDKMPSVAGLTYSAVAIVADSARDWMAEPLFRGRTDPRALRVQMRAARARSRLHYVLRLMVNPGLRALVTQRDWL